MHSASISRRVAVAVSALVLAAATIAFAAVVFSGDSPPKSAEAPSPSPREGPGNMLVLAEAHGDGDWQLFLVSEDGRRSVQLTHSSDPVVNAVWSPDGEWIGYVVAGDGGDVFVMHADGSEDRLVCRGCAPSYFFAGSGSGSGSASSGVSVGAEPESLQVGVDGSPVRVVKTGSEGETSSTIEIFVDGRLMRRVDRGSGLLDAGFSWSPNGDALVFASKHPGSVEQEDNPSLDGIYWMDGDGTDLAQITKQDGPPYTSSPDSEPVWSPDGSLIAFTRRLGFFEPGSSLQSGDHSEIWVVRPDGTGMRRVTETHGDPGATTPAWSPDGRRIAYLSEDGHEISTVGIDGSDPTLVLSCGDESSENHPCATYGLLSWSPEGTELLFQGQTARGSTPYVVGIDGSGLRPVAEDLTSACCALWRPTEGNS